MTCRACGTPDYACACPDLAALGIYPIGRTVRPGAGVDPLTDPASPEVTAPGFFQQPDDRQRSDKRRAAKPDQPMVANASGVAVHDIPGVNGLEAGPNHHDPRRSMAAFSRPSRLRQSFNTLFQKGIS